MCYGDSDIATLRRRVEESTAADASKVVLQKKAEAMIRWLGLTSCRRVGLLAYFDEARNEACGNCDICDICLNVRNPLQGQAGAQPQKWEVHRPQT
jgi:ATP-dependent DNA helicase RecQ